MKRICPLVLALTVVLAVACGDDDPSGPGGGRNAFTATINGAAWVADDDRVQITGGSMATNSGVLVITGSRSSDGRGLALALGYVDGPGTYPLGVNNGMVPGGSGMMNDLPNSWQTPLSGDAGTVTIAVRTDTRIAGTFSFVAEELLGSAPDAVVTSGAFDITRKDGLPALPLGIGSTMHATIDGESWNAATIVSAFASGSFTLAGSNTEYVITMIPLVPVNPIALLDIPSELEVTVQQMGTTNAWRALAGPTVGSAVVTHLSGGILAATFSGTFPLFTGEGDPLVVENGSVDINP